MIYDNRFARTGPGRFKILRIQDESSDTLARMDFTFTPGNMYRFIFTGLLEQFTGELFDLTNSVTPIATLIASDATYPSGYAGFFSYDNSDTGDHPVDLTVDNFRAEEPQPRLDVTVDRTSETVIVTWPSWAVNYSLEECMDLGTRAPADFNNGQTADGFMHTDNFDQRRFYRLVSQ